MPTDNPEAAPSPAASLPVAAPLDAASQAVLQDPSITPAEPGAPRRFLLVDALRGFAALWVVIYHVWNRNLHAALGLSLPEPWEWLVAIGYLGVAIFFVLSGFVIAHSVFGATITPGYFGRFVLRRSLRLDPPYWVSMALAIGLIAVVNAVRRSQSVELPSLSDVAVHLVYLQEILGVTEIVGVYWTLCYEVQFYLAFVLLTGLAQFLSRGAVPARANWAYTGVFATTWVVSLLAAEGYIDSPDGLFIDRWFQFFAGVTLYWTYRRFTPPWVLAVVLIGTVAPGLDEHGIRVATLVTSTLLYVASQTGHLWTASCGWFMQMLGRCSYSLYLTHMLVGSRLARFGAERYPDMGMGWAIVLAVAAILASIAFAYAMYLAVERPSLRLASRIRLKPAATKPVASAA